MQGAHPEIAPMNTPGPSIMFKHPDAPGHIRLGTIPFDNALELQLYTIGKLSQSPDNQHIIYSLEHTPVVTCGKSTHKENLLLSEEGYDEMGIDLRYIDRGGDVTYHGPGQVVVYPVIALRKYNLRAGEYINLLEESMIRVCADFGVSAFRREGYPGCWTDEGKIGSVGASIKAGGITKHGLAINVSTSLDHMKLIVPCGITDVTIARLIDIAPDNARHPDMFEVEMEIVNHLKRMLVERLDREIKSRDLV